MQWLVVLSSPETRSTHCYPQQPQEGCCNPRALFVYKPICVCVSSLSLDNLALWLFEERCQVSLFGDFLGTGYLVLFF